VDLTDVVLAGPAGRTPLHHQHEALRLPTEVDELWFQTFSPLLAADVDAPVTDASCALDSFCLRRELLGTRFTGIQRAEEVEVVNAVQARVHEHRPVRRRLEPLGRPLLEAVLE